VKPLDDDDGDVTTDLCEGQGPAWLLGERKRRGAPEVELQAMLSDQRGSARVSCGDAQLLSRSNPRARHGVLRDGRSCCAQTRAGHPCRRRALENGRCPNHGGLSTGPKTAVGKARIADAQRQRWAQWRIERGPQTPLLITAREVHDGLGGVHRRGDRPVLPAATAEILIARNTAIIDVGGRA
jgi:hypothetical protein